MYKYTKKTIFENLKYRFYYLRCLEVDYSSASSDSAIVV